MNTKALESLLVNVTRKVRVRWENHPKPKWKNTLDSNFAKKVSKELDEIKKFLSTEAELTKYNNALLNIKPFGSKQVHHWTLAQNLLFISLTENPRQAVQSLDKFLKLDHVPVEFVYALYGVKLPREVKLTSDLKLMSFNDIPESFNKKFFIRGGHQINRELFGFSIYPTAAFVKNFRSKPQVKPAPVGTGSRSENYIDQEISDAYLWLCLIGDTRPIVVVHWYNIADWVPFARHSPETITPEIPDILFKTWIHKVKKFTETDIVKAQELHRKFQALKETDKKKLRISLDRLNQAVWRSKQVDKAIDLGIALEALFLEGVGEQLSLMFRLRGAWFLGDTSDSRKKLFEDLNDLYDIRSKAVHNGGFEQIYKKKNEEDVAKLLDRGISYCRKAIIKIISAGKFPEWKSLVLGGNQKNLKRRKIRYRGFIRKKFQGKKTILKNRVPKFFKKKKNFKI
jgi:hypothetical protein